MITIAKVGVSTWRPLPIPGRALVTGWGEKINGGRPARHPAGALRAFKFAPGEFVELLFQFQTPPKPKKKKAPTSCKGLLF